MTTNEVVLMLLGAAFVISGVVTIATQRHRHLPSEAAGGWALMTAAVGAGFVFTAVGTAIGM